MDSPLDSSSTYRSELDAIMCTNFVPGKVIRINDVEYDTTKTQTGALAFWVIMGKDQFWLQQPLDSHLPDNRQITVVDFERKEEVNGIEYYVVLDVDQVFSKPSRNYFPID